MVPVVATFAMAEPLIIPISAEATTETLAGPPGERPTSVSEMFEQILKIGPGDVLIAATFPRYSQRTVKAARYAHGCGACAIVNAVCYLTGTQPDVREVAEFVREKNEYIVHEGSKVTLYQDYAEAFGPRYGFRFVRQAENLGEATEYLRQGCVVLSGAGNSHGGGHLLVLADYSPADGKYLILDSSGNSANWSRAFASWQVIRDNRPEKNPDVLLTSFRGYAAAGACYRGF